MSLDAVRSRRHAILLARIADERVRKNRSGRGVTRAKAPSFISARDSDDNAGGQPAKVTIISAIPAFHRTDEFDGGSGVNTLQSILHHSGPVVVADSFAPESVSRDGSIVLQFIEDL